MSWYYAENNDRRGPIEDAAFDELVRAGTITPATLVWREGMANWAAFSQSGYAAPSAPEAAVPPPVGGVEMGVCSESGRILPRSELVEIDGKLVSAEYKNIVLQRIREGVGGAGLAEDPETIAQRIEAAGWSLSATSCVGRGWAIVKENFWLCVGSTFLVYLVVMAAGMIPFGGIIVQGPLLGGLYWMILKLIRREPAAVGDAFQGFNRGWGQLVGVTLVSGLLAVACMLPGICFFIGSAATAKQSEPPVGLLIGAGACTFVGLIFATYLTVAWVFALPLVADKQIPFWPAMKLSRRIVGMHWWQVFAVFFLSGLIMFGFMIVGMAALIAVVAGASASKDSGLAVSLGLLVGLVMVFAFFTLLPLVFSALCVAYEDILARGSRCELAALLIFPETMAAQELSCPKCHGVLFAPAGEGLGVIVCPRCRTRATFEAFPALFAGPRIGRPGEALVDASEASCFFHAEKRAVIACESCGRFLCALCDLEMEGRHICPTCLASGRKKGALKNLDQFRVTWAGVALLMTIALPLAFYPFTPLFAIGALVVIAVGLRKPGSITGQRKILLYTIAIVFAVAELAGSVYLGKTLFQTFTGASRLK